VKVKRQQEESEVDLLLNLPAGEVVREAK